MKRAAVTFGIAAAMGIFAPTAVGSADQPTPTLGWNETAIPSWVVPFTPSGGTITNYGPFPRYRLGNRGLWME
jgi:hypothetical protein